MDALGGRGLPGAAVERRGLGAAFGLGDEALRGLGDGLGVGLAVLADVAGEVEVVEDRRGVEAGIALAASAMNSVRASR
jgi:hypothetical protein